MIETRMATTSNYGFALIDCDQDPEMLFGEYVEKDKENWQKTDTVIKNVENKVEQANTETLGYKNDVEIMKNEVVAKHDEVLKKAGVIAQDKAIVEQAKTETLGYKNDVEAMKNDVQQLVTDSTEDLILEGNRQVARVSTEGTTQVDLAKAEVALATQQATVATEQAGIAQRYAETAQGELSKVATEGAKQVNLAKAEVTKATQQAGIAQGHAETAQGELSKVTAEGVKQVKAVSDKGVEQVQAVATEGTKQVNLAKAEVTKATQQATVATEQAGIATTKSEEATTQADRATREADRAGAQAQEKVNNKIGLNGVHDDTIFNFIGDENSTISALQIGEKTYSFNGGSSGTTTDNVVDRAGRTQEQINQTFYKRMCKEIPSPSGGPITVENGEEGYVLSAEIKGQTVKSVVKDVIKDKSYLIGIYDSTSVKFNRILEEGKIYFYWFEIVDYVGSGNVVLEYDTFTGKKIVTTNGNGVKMGSFMANSPTENGMITVYISTTDYNNGTRASVKNLAISEVLINGYVPFGLSSTQAIISNNGENPPVVEPEKPEQPGVKNGIIAEDGMLYWYVDGVRTYGGLMYIDGYYYYARTSGEIVTNRTYGVTKTNGLLPEGNYTFDAEGKMVNPPVVELEMAQQPEVKNGIIEDTNGKLWYYEDDVRTYGGLMLIDGNYYTRTSGQIITNRTYGITKTNDLLPADNYTIYHPTELNDDGSKKVLSLGGVGGVYDTLEIKEDIIYTQNTKEIVFNGTESWLLNADNGTCIEFYCKNTATKSSSSLLCDKFPYFTKTTIDLEYVRAGRFIIVSVLKSKLTTQDVDGFKKWLQTNPITVRYQLDTPIVTNIPKELVPTILTHKTNILEVGGAVKPSSFKVTVPVDRIAEIEARLQALESTTVDVVLNK